LDQKAYSSGHAKHFLEPQYKQTKVTKQQNQNSEISKPKPIHVFLPIKAESNAKKSKQEITQT
jgi:hypothetical protein